MFCQAAPLAEAASTQIQFRSMTTISQALAIAFQHHQAGRLQTAGQIYRQILAAEPNHADAMHLLGVIAHQTGEHETAVRYIERAIALQDAAAYHNNLGEAYRALRRIPEAVACYRRALELKPDFADAHNNLGVALKNQGKLDEAVACYRRVLELKPDFAGAENNLGNALKEQGKLEEAVACYRRALQRQPDYAEAEYNLGNVLKEQGKLDEAVACCRRAVELRPDHAPAHNNLGVALSEQSNSEEAVACFRRALELAPDYLDAQNNLGVAWKNLGKLDEAVACYRRALELRPDYAQARYNLANAFSDQGKRDEAIACCRGTLEQQPDFAEAHVQRSLLALLTGDFPLGWAEYPWRWKTRQCPPRDFPQPAWDGQPLEGKTILLHAEQGLGDAIQFVRYAPLVKQRGAAVIVECPGPLMSLLASCQGVDRLVGRGDRLPAFDVHASLLSLPGIFHTSLEDMPAAIPYLFADPGAVERWRRELGGAAGLKIGMAWRGNPVHTNDRARSLPLSCFESLAGLPGAHFFSLQKGAGVEELARMAGRLPVTELGSRLENFMDTAAVMKNLDLVITCDTAAAHLAGALGVPVWVALPFTPDWRWLLDRSDSPWYPTMRLLRQKQPGDWAGVFEEIKARLCAEFKNRTTER